MSGGTASHDVSKLKELLFDSEVERLADLSRRLEALGMGQDELRALLAERKAYEEGARAELSRRLDAVHDRAGSDEKLTRSVAGVLDRAIERAEAEHHDQMREALAPIMVKTVKTEIMNSQDALVEALYPMTGQMVKAYVASAMKDLINQVNRRLESNPLMLRLKSLTTGRSMAELALAESQKLKVEDLLLVRRGNGELIARWPETPGHDNQDHVLGGVLSAINSFATEAMHSEESALRQIDMGASQLYLRSSPAFLLAAKCSGTAAASVEQIIDDEFLATVSDLHGDENPGERAQAGLRKLGPRLGQRISEQYDALDTPALGISPVKILALLIGLPLAAWLAWSTYVTYETNRVRETARHVIETSAEIRGYPTTLAVQPRGRSLTLSGLAPNDTSVKTLLDRLAAALPGTAIDSHLTVVPQGARDSSPDIALLRGQIAELNRDIPRRAAMRSLLVARQGLAEADTHLQRLSTLGKASDYQATAQLAATGAETLTPLRQAISAVAAADKDLSAGTPDAAQAGEIGKSLTERADALDAAVNKLARQATLVGVSNAPAGAAVTAPTAGEEQPPYVVGAERLAVLGQRLQLITVALVQAEITRAGIPKPPPPPPPPVIPGPTPLDRLTQFIKSNAIFFGDSIDYRDGKMAEAQLDALAVLIRDADVLVRVVGYTDERGTVTRNSSLSQLRADKVRDALLARGVRTTSLVAVGRLSSSDISPTMGPQSPNRRVEFELGFKGEAGP